MIHVHPSNYHALKNLVRRINRQDLKALKEKGPYVLNVVVRPDTKDVTKSDMIMTLERPHSKTSPKFVAKANRKLPNPLDSEEYEIKYNQLLEIVSEDILFQLVLAKVNPTE